VHVRFNRMGGSISSIYCMLSLVIVFKQSIIIIVNDIFDTGWACGGVWGVKEVLLFMIWRHDLTQSKC